MVVSVVLDGFSDVRIKPHSGTVSAFSRMQGGDNFILEAGRAEIRNYVRYGDDLIVEFFDGQRLTIKDFFAQDIEYHNLVLESGSTRQFVDFTHAVSTQEHREGDGVDETALSYHAVYAQDQAAKPSGDDGGSSSRNTNIDYNTIVSSVDSTGKGDGGGFAKLFSGKSFFSILGGLGVAGALAEYAYGRDPRDSNDVINPFDDVPLPDALVPPPPPEAEQEQPGNDLRFFSAGAHMIETRIVNLNPALSPIFSMPILTGSSDGQAALPFLESLEGAANPYQNVIVRTSGDLAEGEKVQLRAGNGKWYDAEHDTFFDYWRLSDEQAAAMQNDGQFHWMDSRIVDQNGAFLRSGSSFAPQTWYHNMPEVIRKFLPAIARIDVPVSDTDPFSISGSVVGKFGEQHTIQIRIDGGGWYDVTLTQAGDGLKWQYDDLPTYASTADDDEIILLDNVRDTVFYRLLEDDATGGNGSDTIHNFTIGQWGEADVDRIDIASLLIDYDGKASRYLFVQQEAGNTMLYLYRNGVVDASTPEPPLLMTLLGVQTSLDELLGNGQLILA